MMMYRSSWGSILAVQPNITMNYQRYRSYSLLGGFIALILFSFTAVCLGGNNHGLPEKPNIIFVFCDDLGFGDLGCYGNRNIKTPNLDKMAEEGLLFTNFTVASPVCSPSRVGMMTGQFPSRHAFHGHLADLNSNQRRGIPNFLDPNVATVTRLLQSGGYATGHFGKWHMGGPQDKKAPPPGGYGIDVSATVLSNGPAFKKEGDVRADSSMRIMQHTLDFIEAHADEPFFINCWIIDPHSTLAPSPEQLKVYEKYAISGEARNRFSSALQTYYAVVTDVDRQMGRLMEKLRQLDLDETTLVVFSSDNGPAPVWGKDTAHSGVGDVGPLRGCKASLYEGGIRVPFIVRWPGHTPSGKVDDNTVISGVDLLPTFCQLAGIRLDDSLKLDGEDMSQALLGVQTKRSKPLMWEYRFSPWGRHIQKSPVLAMRDGDWKLMMNPDGSRIELYNLRMNPCEVDNLANENPNLVRRMSKELVKWHKTIPGSDNMPKDAGSFDYPWPEGEDVD